MISNAQLEEAIAEANRFIQKAKELKAVRAQPGTEWVHGGVKHTYPPTEVKEHAACKRSSMDLSRALSTLRKGEL